MGNVATLNTTTLANATAVNAKVVGEAFSKVLMVSSTTKDVFGQMEGSEGSRSAILVKDDLNKMAGQYINFTVSANAGHMPVRGEVSLRGKEEKPRVNSFQVKIDFVRHAISFNKKVQAFMAAGASLDEAYAEVLADHFGRFKETDMKMVLRQGATALNTITNLGKTYNALNSNDVVSTVLLGEGLGNLTMLGAKEIKTSKSLTGASVYRYLFFGTVNCLRALKSNATYAAAVQNTVIQRNNTVIFDGGYTDWDGQGIYAQPIVDPDADGPLGDPLEPRGVLGTAVTAADTTFNLDGGGLNGPDPTLRGEVLALVQGLRLSLDRGPDCRSRLEHLLLHHLECHWCGCRQVRRLLLCRHGQHRRQDRRQWALACCRGRHRSRVTGRSSLECSDPYGQSSGRLDCRPG